MNIMIRQSATMMTRSKVMAEMNSLTLAKKDFGRRGALVSDLVLSSATDALLFDSLTKSVLVAPLTTELRPLLKLNRFVS